MNTIFKKTENILKNAGIKDYKAEARLIATTVSNLTLEEILLKDEIPDEKTIIETANKRALTKAPLQYILGYCYFMDEKYKVNKNVLIPRDETQFLVEKSADIIKNNILNKKEKIKILEIGTGSGCISCALAKKFQNYDIEILAVDISTEALETAMENILRLNLINKVIIRKSDIYSKIRDCEKFDLIVSNPPYIPLKDKDTLDREVVDFEPHRALFAGDKYGISFYKKIIKDAKKYLKKDGFAAFELGMRQSRAVEKIFSKYDFINVEIIKDLSNIERVISAKS